jgi:phytoene synthase
VSPSDLAVRRSWEVIRQKSKSFSLASRFLPASCRDDIVIIYAFCRYVDDTIDLAPAEDRQSALDRLREEIEGIFAEKSTKNLVLDAFAEVAKRNSIPRVYVDELVAGMTMDVNRRPYLEVDDLLLYSYRVAGVVGLLLCHVMKLRDESKLANAAHLGIAMQLTNISRDVMEDLHDGRVYLPTSWLDAPLTNPPTAEARACAVRSVERTLVLADRFYVSADRGIDALPFRCALAVRTARYIYAAIGDRLRARGCDPFLGRAVVPAWTKAFLVLRAIAVTVVAWSFASGGRPTTPVQTIQFWKDILPEGEVEA